MTTQPQCRLCVELHNRTHTATVRVTVPMAGERPRYNICDSCFDDIAAYCEDVEPLAMTVPRGGRGAVSVTAKSGDCFVVAAKLLATEFADDPGARLVHGLPLGTSGEAEGRRYWHAWVEVERAVTFPAGLDGLDQDLTVTLASAIDRSNGHDVDLSPAVYYRLGQIKQTWKYTLDEALRLIDDTGHAGPWVDGWEGMGA